jgi:hypothetical protein
VYVEQLAADPTGQAEQEVRPQSVDRHALCVLMSRFVIYQLPTGWYEATDPTSGATYYYNDAGESTWERPVGSGQQQEEQGSPTRESRPVSGISVATEWPDLTVKLRIL